MCVRTARDERWPDLVSGSRVGHGERSRRRVRRGGRERQRRGLKPRLTATSRDRSLAVRRSRRGDQRDATPHPGGRCGGHPSRARQVGQGCGGCDHPGGCACGGAVQLPGRPHGVLQLHPHAARAGRQGACPHLRRRWGHHHPGGDPRPARNRHHPHLLSRRRAQHGTRRHDRRPHRTYAGPRPAHSGHGGGTRWVGQCG